jgi:hypothetical protein
MFSAWTPVPSALCMTCWYSAVLHQWDIIRVRRLMRRNSLRSIRLQARAAGAGNTAIRSFLPAPARKPGRQRDSRSASLVQLGGNMYPVLSAEARGKTTHSPASNWRVFAVRSTSFSTDSGSCRPPSSACQIENHTPSRIKWSGKGLNA